MSEPLHKTVVEVTGTMPPTVRFGSLKRASEIAGHVRVSADRLESLAEAGLCPHYRVDGGPPLFDTGEVRRWVTANLVQRIEGGEVPWRVSVSAVYSLTDFPPAPEAIAHVRHLRPLPVSLAASGVYFLCRGEDVVYVGQSVNVAARVAQHTGTKDFDRCYTIGVPPDMLDAVEGAFIRALRPELNRARSGFLIAPREDAVAPDDVRPGDSAVLASYAPGLVSEKAAA